MAAVDQRSFPGDRQLLRRFRAGERAALEQVYWAYVDRVEHIIRNGFVLRERGLPVPGAGGNHADVAELTQEVFARAFAPAARLAYDGLREYAPYLDAIARNLLVDRARDRGREIPATDEHLREACDPFPPAAEPAWADPDTVALVASYLAGLPAELRAVHDARYVRSLSQRDAAVDLGISRQQLRTLEQRLRDGLGRDLRRRELARGAPSPR
jgi:RNA polymerase sigma-70 factor (ECF subfamily)